MFTFVSAMNGEEISRHLSATPGFIGVYCSDQLADLRPPESFSLVVNVDSCDQSGSHWQAIAVRDRVCHFFCSFGEQPESTIRDFCSRWPICLYNNIRHQRADEITCGPFCIYFICRFTEGQTLQEIAQFFKSTRSDDAIVRKFMKDRFGYSLPIRTHVQRPRTVAP